MLINTSLTWISCCRLWDNNDHICGLFFVLLYCDSWTLRKSSLKLELPLTCKMLINVFLLIGFCSVYVSRLFGRCSRVLVPTLDTTLLNGDICILFTCSEFSLHVSWSLPVLICYLKQKFITLWCYCSVIYGWLFLISHFFIHVFLPDLVVVVNYT